MISLLYASTCFEHYVLLIIRRSKVYYTASGIITPVDGRPVHRLREVFSQPVPGSSVGIATELRAGRSGIESHWGRDFPPVQTGSGAHLASCTMGTGSFPGVKCGRGVLLTTHPLLVPRSSQPVHRTATYRCDDTRCCIIQF